MTNILEEGAFAYEFIYLWTRQQNGFRKLKSQLRKFIFWIQSRLKYVGIAQNFVRALEGWDIFFLILIFRYISIFKHDFRPLTKILNWFSISVKTLNKLSTDEILSKRITMYRRAKKMSIYYTQVVFNFHNDRFVSV